METRRKLRYNYPESGDRRGVVAATDPPRGNMKTQRRKELRKDLGKAPTPELAKSLQTEVDEAEWTWLKPHADRDAVILISNELNLVEVGLCLAGDDAKTVQTWMEKGKILKPSPTDIQSWDAHPAKKFLILVIQPYVLAQEITLH